MTNIAIVLTRTGPDGEEYDAEVTAYVEEGVVSEYARDDDHGAYDLTEMEQEVVRGKWEMMDR